MARRRTINQAVEVGPVRYSTERFMSSIETGLAKKLRTAFKAGAQLAAAKVPTEALPAVVILASWGVRYDEHIVDDYELLARMRQAFDDGAVVHHPDLFFASCVCILALRDQVPTVGSFEAIGVPDIYANLFGE
jgi:hypothetical protein